MGNMSYCRFENTYNDLVDCKNALLYKEFDELSDSEREYAFRLIKLCERISEAYIDEVMELENKLK